MDFLDADEQQNGRRLFALAIEQQERINAAANEYEAARVEQVARFTGLEKLVTEFVETKRLLAAHGNMPAPILTEIAEIACKHIDEAALEHGKCPPPRTDLN